MAETRQNEIPSGEGLTLEKLWAYHFASIERSDRKWAEMRRQQKETGRMLKNVAARLKETEALIKSNGARIGGLHNNFGELAEHLVGPGIVERFGDLGYRFDGISGRGYKIPGKRKGSVKAEVDLLLENDDTVIAVEVKSRISVARKGESRKDDIAHHVRRLEALKAHREGLGLPPKRILGAIAGAIFDSEARDSVLGAGFFAITQSGDTMRMDAPEGFKPREW